MSTLSASDLVYSWNDQPDRRTNLAGTGDPTHAQALSDASGDGRRAAPFASAGVRLEDDAREALQNVRAQRPSLERRLQMLELSARVGIHVSFLGFPAASTQEEHQCAALVGHLAEHDLALTPVLMARAVEADLRPILDIQQRSSIPVTVDLFISTSPIRATVEGWHLPTLLKRLQEIATRAAREGLDFRIAFEDSTRTPPTVLGTCIRAALDCGARSIVLNDTTGACLPQGARRHVAFAAQTIRDAGHHLAARTEVPGDQVGSSSTDGSGGGIEIAWHGHNDMGLALANSLAAIEAGASLISGTFLGIGERTGNLALEQLIFILATIPSPAPTIRRSGYDLAELVRMTDLVADTLNIAIPRHQPLVGHDAFATATGTHAAAILKARQLGPDFEDAVYSAVPARSLGRRQQLLVNANSGRAGVRAVLQDLGLSNDDDCVSAVLSHAKTQASTLSSADLEAALTVAL